MEINDKSLRITGKVSFSEDIDTQYEIEVNGVVDIYSQELKDNQDATYDLVYKAKFVRGVELKQGDKKIVCKDKQSMSKKMRGAIYHLQDEVEEMNIDGEEFYEKVMKLVIYHLKDIYLNYKDR